MSMKYDAGMTQYHDDIVAALRDMLRGEMDKIAELAAEGSPVPLREYLRNNHGKAIHGGNKFEAMSSCFLVPFDHVINNKGDSKIALSWSQVATFIRKYPSDFFKKNENEEALPCNNCTVPIKPETTVTFDYSELDSDTAAKLESVTAEIYSVRKEYIFTMAKKVAYAHDLLANHYGGKFGAWCESIGISRDTGNNLVRVAEIFGNISTEEQKNLSQLKPSLLYEAARPSAPPELVDQVKSGDITTHKEYIALKKQLEEAEEMNAVLSAEKEQFHRASRANLEKLNEERDRNADLERQLKELESRPRDVAVDTEELNRRLTEASAKLQKQAAEQVAEERRDFADKLNRMEEERDRLESRIAELESSENSTEQKDKEIAELKEQIEHLSNKKIKVFAVKLTVEEFERLMDIAEKSGDPIIANAVKSAQIIRI